MDPQYTLVRIYLFVCRRYRHRLRACVQRQMGNARPDFTDEEVLTIYLFGITIYLFGIIEKRRTISEIYDYTANHTSPITFPAGSRIFRPTAATTTHGGYNQRLNRLSAVFALLAGEPLKEVSRSRR